MSEETLFWVMVPCVFLSGICTLLGVRHVLLTCAYFALFLFFLGSYVVTRRKAKRPRE